MTMISEIRYRKKQPIGGDHGLLFAFIRQKMMPGNFFQFWTSKCSALGDLLNLTPML